MYYIHVQSKNGRYCCSPKCYRPLSVAVLANVAARKNCDEIELFSGFNKACYSSQRKERTTLLKHHWCRLQQLKKLYTTKQGNKFTDNKFNDFERKLFSKLSFMLEFRNIISHYRLCSSCFSENIHKSNANSKCQQA